MPTLLRVSHEENPLPSPIAAICLEGPLDDRLVPRHGCITRMIVGRTGLKCQSGFMDLLVAQGLRSLSGKSNRFDALAI
jgi:hypothetical protein